MSKEKNSRYLIEACGDLSDVSLPVLRGWSVPDVPKHLPSSAASLRALSTLLSQKL